MMARMRAFARLSTTERRWSRGGCGSHKALPTSTTREGRQFAPILRGAETILRSLRRRGALTDHGRGTFQLRHTTKIRRIGGRCLREDGIFTISFTNGTRWNTGRGGRGIHRNPGVAEAGDRAGFQLPTQRKTTPVVLPRKGGRSSLSTFRLVEFGFQACTTALEGGPGTSMRMVEATQSRDSGG